VTAFVEIRDRNINVLRLLHLMPFTRKLKYGLSDMAGLLA